MNLKGTFSIDTSSSGHVSVVLPNSEKAVKQGKTNAVSVDGRKEWRTNHVLWEKLESHIVEQPCGTQNALSTIITRSDLVVGNNIITGCLVPDAS